MSKMLCFQGLAFSALFVTLAACSGTGARIEGTQCPKRWDPAEMNIHPAAKMELKASTLPDGEFVMTRAKLHFKGDPTEKAPDGFQVLVKEDVPKGAKDSTPVAHADCFRNANVDQPYAARVAGLNAVTIKNGQVVASSAKDFGFTMTEQGQFELTGGPSQRKVEKPLDLFNDSTETFVVKYGDRDYEVRTRGRATNGEYALATLLHKIN